MFSAGTLTTAGSIRLSARTKAPSSRVSSNIVAACVCSVEFMSSQDLRASGLRRLSTVSTMACNHGNKRNDKRLIRFLRFPWEKKKDPAQGIHRRKEKRMRLVTRSNYNGKWNTVARFVQNSSTVNVLCVFMLTLGITGIVSSEKTFLSSSITNK